MWLNWIEHRSSEPRVGGSSPSTGTIRHSVPHGKPWKFELVLSRTKGPSTGPNYVRIVNTSSTEYLSFPILEPINIGIAIFGLYILIYRFILP